MKKGGDGIIKNHCYTLCLFGGVSIEQTIISCCDTKTKQHKLQ